MTLHFSFEAGRKCPGGEGLYAFSTKEASKLHDMVVCNISKGGEGGMSNLPNSPESLLSPPVPTLNLQLVPASDVTNHPLTPTATASASRLPKYQNMKYQDVEPPRPVLVTASSSSPLPDVRENRVSAASVTPPLPHDQQLAKTGMVASVIPDSPSSSPSHHNYVNLTPHVGGPAMALYVSLDHEPSSTSKCQFHPQLDSWTWSDTLPWTFS